MGKVAANLRKNISSAATLIRQSNQGVVLTGAGISTPSGIPDFRSAGSGLWNRYDPQEVASLSVFRYNPEKFFAWMRSLALEILQALPNPAHLALAQMEKAGQISTVITQNIDGLHTRAGSMNVLEVHGSLQTLTCIGCYQQYDSTGFIEPYLEYGEIPRCPVCHNTLKPDVVLYEEQLPARTWLKARHSATNCDLMLVAGSSLEVVPVAGLPMKAVERGAKLILINESPTYIDERADIILRGDVAEILPLIAAKVTDE